MPQLPDRSWVPRDVREAVRTDFGAILDPSGRPWRPENTIKYSGFAAFHVALQKPSRTFKSAPGRSQNDPQEAPRSGPGGPGAAQEAPRRPQEPPGAPQERPRSLPNSASERPWLSNGVHLAPKSPPEASRSLFWTPPGTIFDLPGDDFHVIFNPPAGMFEAACVQSQCKHTTSIARRACVTSTCVCTFYMWISTATDRE